MDAEQQGPPSPSLTTLSVSASLDLQQKQQQHQQDEHSHMIDLESSSLSRLFTQPEPQEAVMLLDADNLEQEMETFEIVYA
jgi:hypothetical protein